MEPVNTDLHSQQSQSYALELRNEERTWGLIVHLAGFALFVLPAFGNLIGVLVAWLVFKDRSAFADDQGKEALNFHLSLWTYAIAAIAFGIVTFGLGLLAAVPFLIALAVFQVVMMIVAGIEANNGKLYRYPLTIRFIK
ncbi:MAG: DUF4870 domain-containing protein [Pleurocapsa sp. SU_196_0]|nr:DUF4870 domain-containing protein [Pleurocapsa sp. SU_196_0]